MHGHVAKLEGDDVGHELDRLRNQKWGSLSCKSRRSFNDVNNTEAASHVQRTQKLPNSYVNTDSVTGLNTIIASEQCDFQS